MIRDKEIRLKPQYANNPYMKDFLKKENLNKWLGINASKTADEILEYVRKRKRQIGLVLEERKKTVDDLNGLFQRKERLLAERKVIESEMALQELDEIENYATDYYRRVSSDEWLKQYIETE